MKDMEKLIEQKDAEIDKLKTKIIEQEKLLLMSKPVEKKSNINIGITILFMVGILIIVFSVFSYLLINNGPLLEFKKSHKIATEVNQKIIKEYDIIQNSTKISIKEIIPKEELEKLFKDEDNSYRNIEKIFLNSLFITNPSFYSKEIDKLTYVANKKINIAITINKYKKEQLKNKLNSPKKGEIKHI